MTITDKLIGALESFDNSPRSCKVCFFVIFVASLFHVLSFSSNAWVEKSEGDLQEKQGLWQYCNVSTSKYMCCKSVEKFLSRQKLNRPAWILVARFSQSVGLITSILSVFLSVLCTFVPGTMKNRKVRIVAAVMNFIAAIGVLIGIGVYGGQYRYETWMKSFYPSWSFAFSVIAGICFFVTGLAYILTPSDTDPASSNPINQELEINNIENVQAENTEVTNRNEVRQAAENIQVALTTPSAPPLERTPPLHRYQPREGVWHIQNIGNIATQVSNIARNRREEPRHQNRESRNCCICMDNPPQTVFMPCRHQTCCETCACRVTECPVCRERIMDRINTFQ